MQNIVCFFLKSGNLKKKFYVIVKEQHPRTTNNQRRGQFCNKTTGIYQKYSSLVHVILLLCKIGLSDGGDGGNAVYRRAQSTQESQSLCCQDQKIIFGIFDHSKRI